MVLPQIVAVFNNDSVRFCSRGLVRCRRRLRGFVTEGRVPQRVEEAAVLRERYEARRRRGTSHIEATEVHRGALSTAPVSSEAAVEAFEAALQSSAAFEP